MKKRAHLLPSLVLIIGGTCLASLAQAQSFECFGYASTQLIFQQKVNLAKQPQVALPKLAALTTKLQALGSDVFELEIFDPNIPARSYASGKMASAKDFLKWTYWDRESLLEIKCVRAE